MVQLKGKEVIKKQILKVEFQYLYGAVKRGNKNYNGIKQAIFQYLYGAVKSLEILNPFLILNLFQYLYGAVKRIEFDKTIF
ncbi:hypothetical protein HMPREF9712_01579 [Myroides odoratimimus CCUG 10230]|uniref:Uncharacterized protein n=1 Tax=Myroides odoratimimus CCUG 10230 TaxID=883150 RepID=A0ABN0EAH6_9FLAO|nr:hypothetical protein HMPREF9712_01579 [Myroides odoratimimus CCUG 10230]